MPVVILEQQLIVVGVGVTYVSSNRKGHSVRFERLGGGGPTHSPAVFHTGVLGDLEIRAGRNARKLFANRLSKLGYILAVETFAAHGLTLTAVFALLGIGLRLSKRALDGFRLGEDSLTLVALAAA